MRTRLNIIIIVLLMAGLTFSCKKESDPVYTPVKPYANGAFISNEGNFGSDNASVSYFDFSKDSVVNSIFSTVNNHSLGKLLQSIYLNNNKAYMVLNVSDSVIVTNSDDFKETGFIAGLHMPRYMISYNNKGYITQWGENGAVKVVDLSTNMVSKSIAVGQGPEQMLIANGKLLVCNGGYFDKDSTVSVIDPANDQVVQNIWVGDNPKGLVLDKNNDIWILCYGYIKYDSVFNPIPVTPSKLVKLSGSTFLKINEYIISHTTHPMHIGISKDKSTIYYGTGYDFKGIYAMNITDISAPSVPFIDGSKMFYGLNVNPSNGDIYAFDAITFTGPGLFLRFSSAGILLKQYTTGVAPNGAAFR
jgi:YVTN family beta-propeller protein